MYTEPKIVTSKDLKIRSYVIYYKDGIRHREYNGNRLNLKISPNKATTIKERNKELNRLLYEITKALEFGFNPTSVINTEPIRVEIIKTTDEAFKEVEAEKLRSPLSDKYKREIKSVVNHFLNFLTVDEKAASIKNLKQQKVEAFLNQFKATSTYYMSRRRLLGVFFSEFIRNNYIDANLSKAAPRLKTKAALHKIYTKDQLTAILQFLKSANTDLYLCCLLTYSCMLRPHQEIRLLKRKHFDDNFSTISLSGTENKSARVRVVSIPDYLQRIIRGRLSSVSDPETNIFTFNTTSYNEYYFNMVWTRIKPDMLKMGLLNKEQTIYSFRHTAAVDVYNRTKDIHIIQQLLGHSTMIVTLKYLRGLGELNSQQLKDVLPVLELA
jgi:integrase